MRDVRGWAPGAVARLGERLDVRRPRDVARRLANRALAPYSAETIGAATPAPGEPATLPPPFTDYLAALHEARTLALHEMPEGQRTVLSIGPNGRWYFDWFEEAYGPVDRHVGVEAYVERPAVLPPSVEWVSADVAAPEGVAAIESGTVDLVFSGQNIEHLWPDQVVSFLVEANRVLKPGGWLVMDSPNRDLTAAYRWSMGEHTVELVPPEAEALATHAGFEVAATKGLWLCRDRGHLLGLHPDPADPVATMRRMVRATGRPADSFLWWLEARKVGHPDRPSLTQTVDEVFARNWEERVGRLKPITGEQASGGDGKPVARLARGTAGHVFAGPWAALRAGTYTVELDVRWEGATIGESIGQLETVAEGEVLSTVELVADEMDGHRHLRLPLSLERQRFYVEARLWSYGGATIEVPLELRLSPRPF